LLEAAKHSQPAADAEMRNCPNHATANARAALDNVISL